MKKLYLLLFIFFTVLSFSQEGFQFTTNKKKIKVPFQLINNLIIIPVQVNGVNLNFLLDTGVENTILFSLDDADSLQFNHIEKIKIRGLGSGTTIDALHSKKNKISLNDFEDNNHEIYIVLDQEINFSSQLGIPVHGIIGYEFFKNHFIEINYSRKRLNIYKNNQDFSINKLKQYDEISISLELQKPYIETFTSLNDKEVKTKLLVDSGGSDAMWLFENKKNIQSPQIYFNDFLGHGFSGSIYGKRSRIEKLQIGKQEILYPTISFPDSLSIQNANMVEGRNGSIGGEILKRFDVLFDYQNKKMYLKKNSNFDEAFNYNMSGIEIQHNGLQWIKEELELKTKFVNSEMSVIDQQEKSVKYNFLLKPIYEVTNVREDSPGAIAGIRKGDIIGKINGNWAFKYKLKDITELLQSEEGRIITMEVERKGVILKLKFQLKKIL
ncbi:Aspartyl protease [Flavobacterium swingsii]|uniref:Aspartyl protease n=1 Tax=Flavobacterium swingsii TaxID=498292 RepID=A0A1I0WCH6_9FLAO|nr:aspartyl protease family protein [Flavobacterium swingsii]SFA86274.1 Aspartyl protease [Flavobacterium swingsii]